MIHRHWDGIAAYCKSENKVSLGFVEGLNNKIRVFQRRAYGLKDEEYLRLQTGRTPPARPTRSGIGVGEHGGRLIEAAVRPPRLECGLTPS